MYINILLYNLCLFFFGGVLLLYNSISYGIHFHSLHISILVKNCIGCCGNNPIYTVYSSYTWLCRSCYTYRQSTRWGHMEDAPHRDPLSDSYSKCTQLSVSSVVFHVKYMYMWLCSLSVVAATWYKDGLVLAGSRGLHSIGRIFGSSCFYAHGMSCQYFATLTACGGAREELVGLTPYIQGYDQEAELHVPWHSW